MRSKANRWFQNDTMVSIWYSVPLWAVGIATGAQLYWVGRYGSEASLAVMPMVLAIVLLSFAGAVRLACGLTRRWVLGFERYERRRVDDTIDSVTMPLRYRERNE